MEAECVLEHITISRCVHHISGFRRSLRMCVCEVIFYPAGTCLHRAVDRCSVVKEIRRDDTE
jgi:hypothetical protein